jgi:hypothetical protein
MNRENCTELKILFKKSEICDLSVYLQKAGKQEEITLE